MVVEPFTKIVFIALIACKTIKQISPTYSEITKLLHQLKQINDQLTFFKGELDFLAISKNNQ